LKPAAFEYHRAHTVEEAIELLTQLGDEAKLLAGGQSLVPMMNFRLARPQALIDVTPISELAYIERDRDSLKIGALTPHRWVEVGEDDLLEGFEVMKSAARWIGHYPIRTRGTFGGSIAHADPTAEWCMLAVALDAAIVCRSPRGERIVRASDFFLSLFTTALDPDEMVIEVRFQKRAPHTSLHEFARRAGDFAVVAATVSIERDGDVCSRARIVLGGVADVPLRVREAEEVLAGSRLEPSAFELAGRAAANLIEPPSDVHGSAEYRKDLAAVLVKRALGDAAGDA
jgi:carbon-monoxide dehydrogenase medium subunit